MERMWYLIETEGNDSIGKSNGHSGLMGETDRTGDGMKGNEKR